MYHKEAIENYPLQAYASALLFSPANSIVRRLFQHEEPRGVTIKPPINNGWSACLQTLEGHNSYVRSVAFSHDSTRLASASWDRTVKIWDASSGTCVHTLEGHSSSVSLVAFSHDSTQLASALEDSTVKIWDVSSGTCVHTLEGHSSYVNSVAFSHDSTRLASASEDRTVKIWDASSGTCIHTLNVSTVLHGLSFDCTSTSLHTNIGIIAIPPFQVSTSTDMAASKPQYQNVSLSLDMVWIMRAGSNVLWVPSEYRPSRSAVSGALVGMGVGSGRIWFCEVK